MQTGDAPDRQSRATLGGREFALILLTVAALLLVVNQLFNLRLFGIVLLDGRYLNILATLFLALGRACNHGVSKRRQRCYHLSIVVRPPQG